MRDCIEQRHAHLTDITLGKRNRMQGLYGFIFEFYRKFILYVKFIYKIICIICEICTSNINLCRDAI